MDVKSLVKSKSSNSAISKKSEDGSRQYDKKSRSNANFPTHGMKKRGVYVEKRMTKTNLLNNGKEQDFVIQKPPPRPRAGRTQFLTSVLNILSKSTTGTQYPEQEEIDEGKSREKDKKTKHGKEKFKSKVLNKKFVREDKKKMVVLQSKKDIAQTPSNYSEWSYKDASQNSNISNLMIYEDPKDMEGVTIADELKNAVIEGRNLRVKKLRYLEDDPKTVVADGVKGQKNLYNFFVDLLETTISVYNVKAEYDENDAKEPSKTNLQIDEAVANKLDIGKSKKGVEFADGNVTPVFTNFNQIESEEDTCCLSSETKPIVIEPSQHEFNFNIPKRRKVKRDYSNKYSNFTKPVTQKTKSAEINRRTAFRNKNELINVLKQELEIDTKSFEEPKSIFQALRLMARNKKKLTFDTSIDDKYDEECVLKRRKVISAPRKKTKKYDAYKNESKPAKRKNKVCEQNTKPMDSSRNENYETETESYHSLEVYGFDYVPRGPRNPYYKRTSNDSPTNSDFDFGDVHNRIINSSSTFESMRKFSAAVD